MKAPAIFLDRDNTLIHNDGDLGDPRQVKLIQGAASAIASLQGLGYRIIVVSNQGGVARGVMDTKDVEAVNARIEELVKVTTGATIDRFYYCPYHPDGTVAAFKQEHPWRKPQPGMILQAAQDMELDLDRSWMIGDQMRDMEAGAAAGVRTILLRPLEELAGAPQEGQEVSGESAGQCPPDFVAANLIEAAKVVASQRTTTATGRVVKQRVWAATETPVDQRAAGRTSKTANENQPSRPKRQEKKNEIGAKPLEGVEKTGNQKSDTIDSRTPGIAAPGRSAPASATLESSAPGSAAPGRSAPASATLESSAPGSAAPGRTPGIGPAEDTKKPGKKRENTEAVSESTEVAREQTTIGAIPDGIGAEMEQSVETDAEQGGAESGNTEDTAGREASASLKSIEKSLREILQELRNARAIGADFSYVTVLAIVLQMIAGVCLLGALWLGASDPEAFLRWIAVGVMMQLATVIALLMRQ